MFKWLFKKGDVEEIKNSTRKGFDDVKRDISSVSGWIKHLNSEKNYQQAEIEALRKELATMKS